jgi:alanine-synthesizing transaminase
VPCLTFNGLSKAYLLAGYRSGWVTVTGPEALLPTIRQGLDTLVGMRLGANVPGQCALEVALDGGHRPDALLLPGGRLREQRNAAHAALTTVPGVSCTIPSGGLYLFPQLEAEVWGRTDDEQLVLDILGRYGVLFSPGSAFNWLGRDHHLRMVTLASAEQLRWAGGRLAEHADGLV